MFAAAAQDIVVLEIVNIHMHKGNVEGCTDLYHSSMQKFVGRFISPEKGPECITIVRTQNPNPNSKETTG